MRLPRRDFLAASAIGGAGSIAAAAHGPEAARPGGDIAEAAAREPSLFDRLEDAIAAIPAVNNHLHYGQELETLGWYFPGEIVGRDDAGSRGLTSGLSSLLDLPDAAVTEGDAGEIRARYERFCAERTCREYYHRVGDLANVSHIAFIGRTALCGKEELTSDRLKLVMHTDQFLFPLDNAEAKGVHPRHDLHLSLAEGDLAWAEGKCGPRPPTLSAYLDYMGEAVSTIARDPRVVGAKWGLAYFRPLEFERVASSTASAIYERGDTSRYRELQDFLAPHLLRVCGESGLPVQIHTGLGADTGLILPESNPALLDRVLSDPSIADCKVMILHGGYPYCGEAGVVARRDAVWLDFSWMTLLLHPAALAGYLTEWLQTPGPQSLVFGVDGAGLALFVGTWCARRALALALTALVLEGRFTEDGALAAARAVLRDNALGVYGEKLTAPL